MWLLLKVLLVIFAVTTAFGQNCSKIDEEILEEIFEHVHKLDQEIAWLSPTLKKIVWSIMKVEFHVVALKEKLHEYRHNSGRPHCNGAHGNGDDDDDLPTGSPVAHGPSNSAYCHKYCSYNIGTIIKEFLRKNIVDGIIYIHGNTTVNTGGSTTTPPSTSSYNSAMPSTTPYFTSSSPNTDMTSTTQESPNSEFTTSTADQTSTQSTSYETTTAPQSPNSEFSTSTPSSPDPTSTPTTPNPTSTPESTTPEFTTSTPTSTDPTSTATTPYRTSTTESTTPESTTSPYPSTPHDVTTLGYRPPESTTPESTTPDGTTPDGTTPEITTSTPSSPDPSSTLSNPHELPTTETTTTESTTSTAPDTDSTPTGASEGTTFVHTTTYPYTTTTEHPEITSCDDVTYSGVYKLRLHTNQLMDVECNREYYGMGWVVVQQRLDSTYWNTLNFSNRRWSQYVSGFGTFGRDYWIGLDKLFTLTSKQPSIILFVLNGPNQQTQVAAYNWFQVGDASVAYRIASLGTYSTDPDLLVPTTSLSVNAKFSTLDVDNDGVSNANCAVQSGGGWWYGSDCLDNFNGNYLPVGWSSKILFYYH